MKKFKGILITQDQIDKQGDIFTKEALDNINMIGKPVSINFDLTKIAGKVIHQQRTSNGIKISVEVFNDEVWNKIKIGQGLGIGGIVDIKNQTDNKISQITPTQVGLVDEPVHDDWRVTEKEKKNENCSRS